MCHLCKKVFSQTPKPTSLYNCLAWLMAFQITAVQYIIFVGCLFVWDYFVWHIFLSPSSISSWVTEIILALCCQLKITSSVTQSRMTEFRQWNMSLKIFTWLVFQYRHRNAGNPTETFKMLEDIKGTSECQKFGTKQCAGIYNSGKGVFLFSSKERMHTKNVQIPYNCVHSTC